MAGALLSEDGAAGFRRQRDRGWGMGGVAAAQPSERVCCQRVDTQEWLHW